MAHAVVVIPQRSFLVPGGALRVIINGNFLRERLEGVTDPVVLYLPKPDSAYCALARVAAVSPPIIGKPDRFIVDLDDLQPFANLLRIGAPANARLTAAGHVFPTGRLASHRIRSLTLEEYEAICVEGRPISLTYRGLQEPAEDGAFPPPTARYLKLPLVRDPAFRRLLLAKYVHGCAFCGQHYLEAATGNSRLQAMHLHALGEGGPNIVANGMVACATHHDCYDVNSIHIWDDLTWSWVKGSGQDPFPRHRLHLPFDPECHPSLEFIHQHQGIRPPDDALRYNTDASERSR